ncbi:OmpW/AlkL family protein [Halioxenophilus aromaticivorans]|jgi:outer membrane protein|uniref:OmpW family protein n=1 Tax=Halioxenophilus aromaticivorans TaxID=1306992 RepID=A0AAV3U7Y4_9ALTE
MKHQINNKVSLAAFFLLSVTASLANAQSEPVYSRGDWVIGLNATRVLTDEDLRSASAGGASVPNANLSINNDTTVSFDVSYFLNNQLAFNVFGGIPASADLQGDGSLSGLFLGQTDYGPLILSLQYHVLTGSNFSPYVGAGVGRILFLDEKDRALTDFDVEDTWAPAIQAGFRWNMHNNWSANFDIRYAPFKTDITGNLGAAPVQAEVRVHPTIVGIGATYRF